MIKTKIPLVDKSTVRNIRILESEMLDIKKLSKKYSGGNISLWMRYTAAHFKPIASDLQKLEKLQTHHTTPLIHQK